MLRIVLHWTGGAHTPNGLDLNSYHFVIDGRGNVLSGKHPIHANRAPLRGDYAAHTRGLNSDSIGIALAAMAGATERPFNAGRHPVTQAQVDALVTLCRKLAQDYRIAVTPQTILTHAEVEPTLGIKQRGKWDITWLPGMDRPGNPVAVGNKLRALIAMGPAAKPAPAVKPAAPATMPVTHPSSFWARIRAALGL